MGLGMLEVVWGQQGSACVLEESVEGIVLLRPHFMTVSYDISMRFSLLPSLIFLMSKKHES